MISGRSWEGSGRARAGPSEAPGSPGVARSGHPLQGLKRAWGEQPVDRPRKLFLIPSPPPLFPIPFPTLHLGRSREGLGGGIPSSEIRAQLLGDAVLSAEMRARLLSSHLAATPHSEMRSRLLSSDHLSSGDLSSGDLSVGNLSARNLSAGFSQLASAVHLVLTIRASTGGVEALAEKLAWLVAHRPVLERLLQGEPKPKLKPESKPKPKP